MAKLPPRPRSATPAGAAPTGITTTFGALLDAEDALARLSAERLPFQVAYHIAKLARLVAAETKHFQQKRSEWIRELGVSRPATEAEARAGATEICEVTKANKLEFQERINAAMKATVEIAFRPLDIGTLAGVVIAAEDLNALDPLISGEPPAAGAAV